MFTSSFIKTDYLRLRSIECSAREKQNFFNVRKHLHVHMPNIGSSRIYILDFRENNVGQSSLLPDFGMKLGNEGTVCNMCVNLGASTSIWSLLRHLHKSIYRKFQCHNLVAFHVAPLSHLLQFDQLYIYLKTSPPCLSIVLDTLTSVQAYTNCSYIKLLYGHTLQTPLSYMCALYPRYPKSTIDMDKSFPYPLYTLQ